jgi:thiamine kinase-like enzyme
MALRLRRANLVDRAYLERLLPNYVIHQITKIGKSGSSATLCRLETNHGPLFLRKSMGYYQKIGFIHEMHLNHYLAGYGLVPQLHVFDASQFISISDYIYDQNFYAFYEKKKFLAIKQLLHTIKLIHRVKIPSFVQEKNIIKECQRITERIPRIFLTSTDRINLQRILETEWPQDAVSLIHGDLHPNNIIFDGNNYFIIDLEMAGIGHPLYDIAYLSNYLSINNNKGLEILNIYLERKATEMEKIIFNDLRRIGYGFLALINFICAVENRSCLSFVSSCPIKKTFECIYGLWTRATQEKNDALHYHLGVFFLSESLKY